MGKAAYSDAIQPAAPKTIAELRGISKRFGDVLAASDLNLSIAEGEFLSFLGPSGCGKTTALRILAGFETPSEGDVLLDGEVVNDLDAHHRPVNMVFQHYALFPHMTVAQNIAYGLKQRRPRPPKNTIAQMVQNVLPEKRLQKISSPDNIIQSFFSIVTLRMNLYQKQGYISRTRLITICFITFRINLLLI